MYESVYVNRKKWKSCRDIIVFKPLKECSYDFAAKTLLEPNV